MSTVARRWATLVAVLAFGMVVTGCGEVRQQTQWSSDRHHGVSAQAGDLRIRGTVVVADEQGDQATVYATLANEGGEDELLRVRVGSSEAEPGDGPLTVPANGYAKLGPDDTRLDVDDSGAVPGMLIEVEFIFASAPRATVNALVQEDEGIYAGAFN